MEELILQKLGLLSNPVLAMCAVHMAKSVFEMRRCITTIEKSITELNLQIALVVERVDHHERRINRLEEFN